jgi:metal-sulfur cluster biosynthetic enzyme
MTDADLMNALRDCYSPHLRRNIVDLGLIRSATLSPDPDAPGASIPGAPPRHIAHITLLAPTSDDTANTQLAAQIENRLLGLQAISHATVTLLPALFPIL